MTQADLGSEWRAPAELARLLRDPVYRGRGLPRGDGRAVVVLPGLFGNDLYLRPLRSWLRRIGYEPIRSALLLNAGCPERLVVRLQEEVEKRCGRDQRIAVVGHSRGGILGRSLALRLGAAVTDLILVGSPVGALGDLSLEDLDGAAVKRVANETVLRAAQWARRLSDPDCSFPDCACPFVADLRHPLPRGVRTLSLFSRDDPVVSPWACHVEGGRNVEVAGTHGGLVYNVDVYRAMAEHLAREAPLAEGRESTVG